MTAHYIMALFVLSLPLWPQRRRNHALHSLSGR
jgi:hypothetical protein